jgi:hypothetical protein
VLPTSKNSDGRVGLAIVGSLDEVKRDVDKIAPHLQHSVLKELLQPQHEVKVDSVCLLQNGKIEVIFQVIDRTTNEPAPASIIDDFLKRVYKPAPAGAAAPAKPYSFSVSSAPAAASTPNPAYSGVRDALKRLGCDSEYDAQNKTFTVKVRRAVNGNGAEGSVQWRQYQSTLGQLPILLRFLNRRTFIRSWRAPGSSSRRISSTRPRA